MKRPFIVLAGILLVACSASPPTIVTHDLKRVTPILSLPAVPPYLTLTPTPTRTPTSASSPMPTPAPTETLKSVLLADRRSQTVPSPDGKLVGIVYETYWHSFSVQVIEVQDVHGEVIWAIPYQGQMPRGDPRPTMRIGSWATDGSKLYFYYSWAYDGGYTLFDGSSLQELDIQTGSLKDIAAGNCMAFSFSPRGDKIAYAWGGHIGIYDMATGNDHRIDIQADKIAQVGHIHWAPSQRALVFTVMKDDAENAREIYVDLQTLKQKVLLDDAFIEFYGFAGWDQTENPQYLRRNEDTGAYESIVIDTQTAAVLVVGTLTPMPTLTPAPAVTSKPLSVP